MRPAALAGEIALTKKAAAIHSNCNTSGCLPFTMMVDKLA
jgi:hypothetical protein